MFIKGESNKLNHYEYFEDLNGKRELQVSTREKKSNFKKASTESE